MWLKLRAIVLSALLLAAQLGLPAVGGYVLAGWLGAVVITGALALASGLAARYGDRYALRAAGARLLQPWHAPELFRLTRALAARAALVPPRLYWVDSDQPNAMTVGHAPETASIVLTRGLLRRLGWRELMGVIAHELAHIQHRDILVGSIAASVTGLMIASARLVFWPVVATLPVLLWVAPQVALLLVLLVVSPIVTVLLQAAFSRQREFAADAQAALWTGDPVGLAAALEALRPRLHPLWALLLGRRLVERAPTLLDSHPPTAERVARLLALEASLTHHPGATSS